MGAEVLLRLAQRSAELGVHLAALGAQIGEAAQEQDDQRKGEPGRLADLASLLAHGFTHPMPLQSARAHEPPREAPAAARRRIPLRKTGSRTEAGGSRALFWAPHSCFGVRLATLLPDPEARRRGRAGGARLRRARARGRADARRGERRRAAAGPGDVPPTAKLDTAQMLKDDLAAKRSPSDGGGRAWLEPGADGAAGDGQQLRRASSWSSRSARSASRRTARSISRSRPSGAGARRRSGTPMRPATPRSRRAPATSCSTPRTLGPQLLQLQVTGRPLVAGDRVTLVYGAGAARRRHRSLRRARLPLLVRRRRRRRRRARGAAPTRRGSTCCRGLPAQLQVTLPGTARPGERVAVTLALLDAAGNAGTRSQAEIVFPQRPAGLELPARVALAPADGGRKTVLRGRARARDRPAARRGPGRPLGREQSAADLARGAARAVGRSARPLELLGRNRHARGLLLVCARRLRARRRRAHRPRSLGHAPARRASRDVGRDPAPDAALPRAGPLRDAARLRVDQLDPGPSPRAALRGRGEAALVARPELRVARPALARAGRKARPHLRAPLRGRTDRHQLGDSARSRARADHRDRVGAREQRGARLADADLRPGRRETSCATRSVAATASASSEAATATTGIPAWRSSLRLPAAWRRSSPKSARARACWPRCAPGASTPPTGRGSCCARRWARTRWARASRCLRAGAPASRCSSR